jgi:hypothetical protein|tara:strand:+ start:113 stop:265 length:153 start_codon:yes stop_codon:yes gene_type:complete
MLDKLKKFESLEGLGIVLFCLLIIVFGPLAKLLAYGGVAWGVYKLYKAIK